MNDVDRNYDGNEIQDSFTFAHMYLATDFAMKKIVKVVFEYIAKTDEEILENFLDKDTLKEI